MKKACFITPYYGKFPNYFPLWLNCARFNADFDFYFITDIQWQESLPENVIFVNMTLESICERIEEKLGITPALQRPYKLCDFKPAYGFLFPEIIRDYPFWGYIDIDIIFGDMSRFLTDELFANYSKIGMQGHLTLLRNCDACNLFFRTDPAGRFPDYRTAFTQDISFHFDESGLIAHSDEYGIPSCPVHDYYDIMPHRYPFLVMLPGGGFAKSIGEFDSGKLYLTHLHEDVPQKREILYMHFQKRTMSVTAGLDEDHYLAIPNRFVPAADITPDVIESVNQPRIYWSWYRTRAKMLWTKFRSGILVYRLRKFMKSK